MAQGISPEAALWAQGEDLGKEVDGQVWSGTALPHPQAMDALCLWKVPPSVKHVPSAHKHSHAHFEQT